MLLNENQFNSLIQVLIPRFGTAQSRRALLERAFRNDRELVNISHVDRLTPEQFTLELVSQLAGEEIRTRSGELALLHLLTFLQQDSPDDQGAFARSIQPFVNLLQLSNTGTGPSLVADTTAQIASKLAAGQIPPMGRVKVRRRRRRSPISKALKQVAKFAKWQVILATLLVLILAPTALVLAMVTDVNARVNDSYVSLKRTWALVSEKQLSQFGDADFTRLRARIDDLRSNIESARSRTSFLRPFAAASSAIGPRLTILDAAEDVVRGAQDMITGVQPTLVFLLRLDPSQSAVSQLSSSERIAELLRVGQSNFTTAGARLASADKRITSMDVASLPPDILLATQELLRYNQQLEQIDRILLDGPDLLTKAFGLDRGQNYLVLSQNSDELRPSGGYLSTWGWIYVQRAHVLDYGYSATTTTSPNPPPDAPQNIVKAPSWWIHYLEPIYTAWDGSWYADFPSTAKMASTYYQQGDNPRAPVDGVVGLDMYGFEDLLSGLGNIAVPGYDTVINADNFRQVTYRIREQSENNHKVFLAALFKQILGNWQNMPPASADAIFAGMLKGLQEKHIMIYFRDPELNQAVNLLGWSGAQTSGPNQDYLMVADANVGGSKSNRSIVRQLTYDAEIQGNGSVRSRVSIQYDFSAAVAAQDPGVNPKNYADINYFDVIQLFAAKDSNLIVVKNLQNKVDELKQPNLTDFITRAEVKFDSSERFQFLYATAPIVESYGPYHIYRLLLQKQAGTPGDKVDIQIALPAAAAIVTASPLPIASYRLDQPILEFHTQLTTDQWIEIVYKS